MPKSDIQLAMGKLLQKYRIQCGHSRNTLAVAANISPQTLKQCEQGLNSLDIVQLLAVAQILDTDIASFFPAHSQFVSLAKCPPP